MSDIRLLPGDLDDPQVQELLAALDAYLAGLYPPQSNHGPTLDDLRHPEVRFVVASDDEGPIGCGAVVLGAGTAEIKRMYVRPADRGRGLGQRVLAHLETLAAVSGCRMLQLETGTAQPEAQGLYERAGYAPTGPFGHYQADPLSIFMAKPLGGQEGFIGRGGSFP